MVRMVVVATAGALMLAGCTALFDDKGEGPPDGAAAGQAAGELSPAGRDAGAAAAALAPTAEDEGPDAAAAKKKAHNANRAKRARGPAVPSDAVRALQLQLSALGYDPGPPDGLFGPRSRAALKSFQQDRGLTADGKPTRLVMQRVASEVEQGSAGIRMAQGDACMDDTRPRKGFLRAAIRWIFAEKVEEGCGPP